MTKFEKISLIFGIVALLADLASLLSFVTGVTSLAKVIPPAWEYETALFLYKIVSFLFLVYGWLIVSWYLTRRSLLLRPGRRSDLEERAMRAVSGIGLLLIPLAISWLLFVAQPGSEPALSLPSRAEVELTPTLKPIATASAMPEGTLPSAKDTSPAGSLASQHTLSPESDVWVNVIFGLLFGMPFLGFALWGSIVLLMPLVNVDLLRG